MRASLLGVLEATSPYLTCAKGRSRRARYSGYYCGFLSWPGVGPPRYDWTVWAIWPIGIPPGGK